MQEIATGHLRLIQGDAARCPWPAFELMVANLPYSISSPVVFRLIHSPYEAAVLMFQREFAERMRAPIGSSECGQLSVMVQTWAQIEACFIPRPSAFSPRPAVDSEIVRIKPRGPFFPVADPLVYADVVRVLFMQRQKTIRNSLRAAGGALEAYPNGCSPIGSYPYCHPFFSSRPGFAHSSIHSKKGSKP